MKEKKDLDQKIEKTVKMLNLIGIPTSGSCEGHIDHGAPAPWVKITPQKEGKESKRLEKKISELLEKFYKNRDVAEDARITIEAANFGFWIHNGDILYKKWREEVKERVREISNGGVAYDIVGEKERDTRTKRLWIYQKEFEDFAIFLEKETEN